MKGQLSRVQDLRQEGVENRLYSLGTVKALLEHDALRVRQAIKRTGGQGDLLVPVLDDFEIIRELLDYAQEYLQETWERGQKENWRV